MTYPTRDWPAILGAGHPLAQPGALVLDPEDDGTDDERWIQAGLDEDGLGVRLWPPDDGVWWTADYSDLGGPCHATTALVALSALADELEAEARTLCDRAALCRGER